VAADDLPALYEDPVAGAADRRAVADHLRRQIVFGDVNGQMLSAAEMILALLELPRQMVDGPTAPGKTTYAKSTIPMPAFRTAIANA
jgi:hypothetical protein